ncbi:MAG: PAS domain-containing protein, partial [Candidatus Methylacidiphilales bacterium]
MQKKDSLEFKILLKVTINIGIMSVLATIANLITGLYFLSIITSSASILYFVIYYLLKSKPFITIHNTFVIITFYIYCILLWFFNGGTFGITLLLLFILYFICSFIIQLKNQTVFFIGSLAIILTLIITEFYFPKLIPQVYIERFDRYLDISIGSLISLLMVKLLVNIIKSNYNDERRLVQKRNEELETSRSDLRESKDFFNKLVENLPGVSYQFCMQLNGEIKFNFISGAVESIYRVSAEQVYADGHILFKMITDDTILQFNNELNNSFRNISYFNNEHKIITPNGNKKHILTLAKPEKQEDGSVIWYGYNKDITDRKIEAENVIASENKFRFISENTSDGIIVLEKTGITYTSDSYLKMVGYTKEKIFARTEEQILSFIHPNDCDGLLNAVELANQEKLPNLTYSYRYLHKDGHYFWREDTFSFFYNELGENYKDIIVVRNIDG